MALIYTRRLKQLSSDLVKIVLHQAHIAEKKTSLGLKYPLKQSQDAKLIVMCKCKLVDGKIQDKIK